MVAHAQPRRSTAAPAPVGEPQAHAAAARVLRHFRLVFNAVKTHFRAVEKQTGVSGSLVWALSMIEQHPGIGISDLARRMDIHQSTTSNLVKRLIARGLAEGVRDGPDRRAVQLRLCDAGREVLAKAPQPFAGVLNQALNALDEDTLQRLERDMGTLIQTLGPASQADDRTPIVPT
ncbi:MAG: MarR family winged helix-turn-helix transcriptional regulator [Pseudomonadota bacterium]